MPSAQIGFFDASTNTFYETLREICHLCAKPISRTMPVGILPCCNRGVHILCAVSRYDYVERCPLCCVVPEDDEGEPCDDEDDAIVLSLDFLKQVHAFFRTNQWYYVFKDHNIDVGGWISTEGISSPQSDAYQAFLLGNRREIFLRLGAKVDDLIQSTKHSVEFLNLFYWDILETHYHPTNHLPWYALLRSAAEEHCQVGNAFNLFFSVLGGKISPEFLEGLNDEKRSTLGVENPQLLQVFPLYVDELAELGIEAWEPTIANTHK